jgi:plastocyanin
MNLAAGHHARSSASRSRRPHRIIPTVAIVTVTAAALALPAAARAPARMLVIAQEYSLMLSRGSVPAGALTVQLYNRGQDAHNLNVRRVDSRGHQIGSAQTVTLTQSGALSQATWHLAAGQYELYCSLPGHERLGMRAYLVVR